MCTRGKYAGDGASPLALKLMESKLNGIASILVSKCNGCRYAGFSFT